MQNILVTDALRVMQGKVIERYGRVRFCRLDLDGTHARLPSGIGITPRYEKVDFPGTGTSTFLFWRLIPAVIEEGMPSSTQLLRHDVLYQHSLVNRHTTELNVPVDVEQVGAVVKRKAHKQPCIGQIAF